MNCKNLVRGLRQKLADVCSLRLSAPFSEPCVVSFTVCNVELKTITIITITSLAKVIWEEGPVAALSHTYAVKSPLVIMARPKFVPKSTPSRRPIPKPHYLPHSWTRPTYGAKRHPDPIGRFAAMHWTDRPMHARTYVRTYVRSDRPADRTQESLTTRGRCATRATRPNNNSVVVRISS